MGFLPPAVSTQAPKGIRPREPLSVGMATSSPACSGVRPMDSLNSFTVGPKRETDASPLKKASVAKKSACRGLPLRANSMNAISPSCFETRADMPEGLFFKNFAMTVFQNASTVARRPRPRPDVVQ